MALLPDKANNSVKDTVQILDLAKKLNVSKDDLQKKILEKAQEDALSILADKKPELNETNALYASVALYTRTVDEIVTNTLLLQNKFGILQKMINLFNQDENWDDPKSMSARVALGKNIVELLGKPTQKDSPSALFNILSYSAPTPVEQSDKRNVLAPLYKKPSRQVDDEDSE